ncbi:MAG: hypothetical protein JW885_07470 [Deltaproteobacteria bacterium]|nr:hypothetical protein [Candidatus Zymogenaceae bacterium]
MDVMVVFSRPIMVAGVKTKTNRIPQGEYQDRTEEADIKQPYISTVSRKHAVSTLYPASGSTGARKRF